MPIQDKTITIKGAPTKLTCVQLWPQSDGSVVLIAVGQSVDGLGNTIQLSEARIQASGVAALDNLCSRALTELRKANGVEV